MLAVREITRKHYNVRVVVQEHEVYGLVAEVKGVRSPALELDIQEYVEQNLGYYPDGQPGFFGNFAALPKGARIIFKAQAN